MFVFALPQRYQPMFRTKILGKPKLQITQINCRKYIVVDSMAQLDIVSYGDSNSLFPFEHHLIDIGDQWKDLGMGHGVID